MKDLKAFFGFITAFLILDAAWIGLVALDLYREQISSIMLDSPRMGFAALFYVAYAGAVVLLAIKHSQSKSAVLLNGSILGFIAYGTYTVTNYSMLSAWTLTLVVTDILWGGFVTATCALAGYYASHYKTNHTARAN